MSRLADAFRRTPRWLLLAGTLALAFYCVNAVHYGKEPLRIEESEWPPMAKAIYDTGRPIIYADQTHRIRFDEDLSADQTSIIGAWHPPLYLYTLAATMAVVGTDSPHALRAVGVAGLLAAIVLLLVIAREVTARWREVGGVASILLLIHPFAIQGSVFLDIDPSIYTPAALLVIWLAIRYGRQREALGGAQVLALSAAIALVMWAKMTTTVVLLGVLVIWWLLSRRPIRRAGLEAAAFVAGGLTLFFLTYGLWCVATGIAFSYTFEITFIGKSGRAFSEWWLTDNAAHWHLRWFGAGVVLLAVVYLVGLVRNLLRERTLRAMDLPFLVGVGILLLYIVVSPTDGTYQGKYAFPALVMMMLPISWMLLRAPLEREKAWRWALAAGPANLFGEPYPVLAEQTVEGARREVVNQNPAGGAADQSGYIGTVVGRSQRRLIAQADAVDETHVHVDDLEALFVGSAAGDDLGFIIHMARIPQAIGDRRRRTFGEFGDDGWCCFANTGRQLVDHAVFNVQHSP